MTFDGVVFVLTTVLFYGALGMLVAANHAMGTALQHWRASVKAREDAKQYYIDTMAVIDEYQFELDRAQRRMEG